MGMRINTTLPLPAELKAEYPLSKELTEIKKKGMLKFGTFLQESQTSLSSS